MDYEEIIEAIRQAGGGLSRDAAERAAQATLQTLAERLPRGEARHILQELPAELKPFIYTETDAEALDNDEFLSRVADREGTDVETALRHARAVFAALGREAGEPRAAALPQTYEPLVAEAQFRYLEIMPADQFWDRVGQPLGLGRTEARQVTEAVLETLAERIAAGQVEDLMAQLDPLLHPPLRQGMASAPPGARRMSLEDFLRQVAAREGAGTDEEALFSQVFEHARAVFATLSEAVSRKEWFDIVVELPEDHRPLMPAGIAGSRSPRPLVGTPGRPLGKFWPSEHLERLRAKGRRELRVQGGQVIAAQLDVERRAVLIHVIRPAGPRDGADALLAEHPGQGDLDGRGVAPGSDVAEHRAAQDPSLLNRRVCHDRDVQLLADREQLELGGAPAQVVEDLVGLDLVAAV